MIYYHMIEETMIKEQKFYLLKQKIVYIMLIYY